MRVTERNCGLEADLVTVVIPNYNGIHFLEACLDSLLGGTLVPKIIVVDNGSTDGSTDFLREKYPQVLLYEIPVNTGFCHAVNVGLKLTRTPYCILLNNDVRVDPRFAEELVAAIETDDRCFSVQAKMLSMKEPEKIDDTGDFLCSLGWAFARGHGRNAKRYARPGRIFSACAGAAIYRMSAFGEIGLFDERHYCYLEDVDIGYRALLYGYKNRYCPSAVVYHAGSATTGSRHNPFKVEQSACNTRYLLFKNMPRFQYVLHLPLFRLGEALKRRFFRRLGMGAAYESGLARGDWLCCLADLSGACEDEDTTYRKGSLAEEAFLQEGYDKGLDEVLPLYLGRPFPFTIGSIPRVLYLEGFLL